MPMDHDSSNSYHELLAVQPCSLPILLSPTIRKVLPPHHVLTGDADLEQDCHDANNYSCYNNNSNSHTNNNNNNNISMATVTSSYNNINNHDMCSPLTRSALLNARPWTGGATTDSPTLPSRPHLAAASAAHPLVAGFLNLAAALETVAFRCCPASTVAAGVSVGLGTYSAALNGHAIADSRLSFLDLPMMGRPASNPSSSVSLLDINSQPSASYPPTSSILSQYINTGHSLSSDTSTAYHYNPSNAAIAASELLQARHLTIPHTSNNAPIQHNLLNRYASDFSCSASAGTSDAADMSVFHDSMHVLPQSHTSHRHHEHSMNMYDDGPELGKRKRIADDMIDTSPSEQLRSIDVLLQRNILHRPSKVHCVATTTLSSRFAHSVHVQDGSTAAAAADTSMVDNEISQTTNSSTSNDTSGGIHSSMWATKPTVFGLNINNGLFPPNASLVRKTSLVSNFDSDNGSPDIMMDQIHRSLIPTQTADSNANSGVDTLQASHRSTAIEAHVAALAASYGMHLSVMQRMWEEKRRELESNLGMLWHGMPSDSYDDVKLITQSVLETAHWLSNRDLCQLRQLIPTWHLAEHKLNSIIKYIQITEDLKITVEIGNSQNPTSTQVLFQPTDNLSHDTETLMRLVISKREMYGDIIRQEGLSWRVLGFPMDELDPLFSAFGNLMHRIMLLHLSRLGECVKDFFNSFQGGSSSVSRVAEKDLDACVLKSLDLLSRVSDLLGLCTPLPIALEELGMNLCIFYVSQAVKDISALCGRSRVGQGKFTGNSSGEDSMGRSFNTSSASQSAPKAARSADAKIAYCCERLMQLMLYMRTMSSNSEQGIFSGISLGGPLQSRLCIESPRPPNQAMNDPNNESVRSSTAPASRNGQVNTQCGTTASKADAECRKNRSLIRPYILGSASPTSSTSVSSSEYPPLTMLTRAHTDVGHFGTAPPQQPNNMATTSLRPSPLDPMAYPPDSNCSSSFNGIDIDVEADVSNMGWSTPICNTINATRTPSRVSPAMEQLSTLLVEAGLMLCELACISRASSPVVTTGNPGDHFMTGVACRFVYAIFQIVCHELDSSTCDWMQRLMHAIIPDEDTSESLSSTW
ncbi:hypothetical protein BASA50_002968 [Batrachochytrium salamandrivorans]|uniref:Exocyst complex component Sec8 n=1 Tax=Batrachochytrium salamandrivorans TaxID=1357716 RepID=A0ABQ8FMX0_9FUNG|nr:hypothetical protein BASA50_002968 [Batrachochytrium salamandrivorans]KAH9268032.1 hypothetical protein BASA84_000500 [Batrachochytrium salamandrivorans]